MRYIFDYHDEDSYLEHHGIKGQKWGVSNGPPYPLDYESHSKSETQKNPKKLLTAGNTLSERKKILSKSSTKNDETMQLDKHKEPKRVLDNSKNRRRSSDTEIDKIESLADFNRELLKKNPNAAVANPNLLDWAKAHKKELAIGAGAVAAIGIGVLAYKYGKRPVGKIGNLNADAIVNAGDRLKKLDNIEPAQEVKNAFGGFKSNEERFIAQWLKADIHRYDPITQEAYEKMATDDSISLNIGEKLYRMSKGEHSTLRDGIEYVSFGDDHERYMGFLPQMWRANGARNTKFYEAELTALKAIKAPGKRESIDILEAALKKKYSTYSDKFIHQLALKNFYKYQVQLIDRDDDVGKLYFQEAVARGYNAVIDWNDAERLANKPLILINASQQASVKTVHEFSLKQTREVFKNIKLPTNVSDFSLSDWQSEPLAFLYNSLMRVYTE